MPGAGRITFKEQRLVGEVTDAEDYFAFDKARYLRYLEDFKKGWHYYLSALECELIEQKLLAILESETFRHTRGAAQLSLLPDRLTDINLRISEKVQISTGASEGAFPTMSMSVDPNIEEKTVNIV